MSNILRLTRSFYGLSQAELARRLNINKSYISEVESGKRPISLQTIRRYAEVFEVPASALLFFMEQVEQEYTPSRGILQTKTMQILEWIRAHTGSEDEQSPKK